jgi:hypothetical protein
VSERLSGCHDELGVHGLGVVAAAHKVTHAVPTEDQALCPLRGGAGVEGGLRGGGGEAAG